MRIAKLSNTTLFIKRLEHKIFSAGFESHQKWSMTQGGTESHWECYANLKDGTDQATEIGTSHQLDIEAPWHVDSIEMRAADSNITVIGHDCQDKDLCYYEKYRKKHLSHTTCKVYGLFLR